MIIFPVYFGTAFIVSGCGNEAGLYFGSTCNLVLSGFDPAAENMLKIAAVEQGGGAG